MRKWLDGKNKILVVFVVMQIIVAGIFYNFLPNRIPIQWNGTNISNEANKSAIFLIALISIFMIFITKPICLGVLNIKSNTDYFGIKLFLLIVSSTIELYIIAYCFGLRIPISIVLILELLVTVMVGYHKIISSK